MVSAETLLFVVLCLCVAVRPSTSRLFLYNHDSRGRSTVMGYPSQNAVVDSKRYLFNTDRPNGAVKAPPLSSGTEETTDTIASGGKVPRGIFDKPSIEARTFTPDTDVPSLVPRQENRTGLGSLWNLLKWLFVNKQSQVPPGTPPTTTPNNNKNSASPTKGRKVDAKRRSFELAYRQHLEDGKSTYHPLLQRGFEHFRFATENLAVLIDTNKEHLHLVGKAAVGLWIGVYLTRKVVHWYTGISEFEVLLDQRDDVYHSHGAILHEIGVSLLRSLNHTAVSELKYDNLYDKVVTALEKPCYPQTMSSYCVASGRSTAVLLSEIDNRVRVYRRRISRHKAAAHRGGSTVSGAASSNSTESASAGGSDAAEVADTAADSASVRSAAEEGLVLVALQHSITLLQARQSDAFLRLTRTQLLTSANTIEDLLALRRDKALRSHKSIYSAKLSLKGVRSVSKVSRAKYAGEKSAVLERTLRSYYEQVSAVQKHLDYLSSAEEAIAAATATAMDANKASPAHHQRILQSNVAWEALSEWVSTASLLATQSLRLVRGNVEGAASAGTSTSAPPASPVESNEDIAQQRHIDVLGAGVPPPRAALNRRPVLGGDRTVPVSRPFSLTLPAAVHRATGAASEVAATVPAKALPTERNTEEQTLQPSVAQAMLTAITNAVFGERTSGAAVERTAMIAQLALMVVHLLSTTHNSDTEIHISEFTLDGDVASVVVGTVVQGHPLHSALQQSGHEITLLRDWEPVHRNNLSFARQLYQLDGGVLNTTLLNNMWSREVGYKSLHYNALLESDVTEHTLLQVLNTAGKILVHTQEHPDRGGNVDVNAQTAQEKSVFVGTSAVLLALYMDLSSHSIYTEGANCSLKWVFTPVPSASAAAHPHGSSVSVPQVQISAGGLAPDTSMVYKSRRTGLRSHRAVHHTAHSTTEHAGHHNDSPLQHQHPIHQGKTRVRVTMNFNATPGIYHLLQRHYAVKKMTIFVENWRSAAVHTSSHSDAATSHHPLPLALAVSRSLTELSTESGSTESAIMSSLQHNIASTPQHTSADTTSSLGLTQRPQSQQSHNWQSHRIRTHYVSTVDPTCDPRSADLLRLRDDDGAVYFHSIHDPSADAAADSRPPYSHTDHDTDGRSAAGAASTGVPLTETQQGLEDWSLLVQLNFQRQREQWRASGVILQDLQTAPVAFSTHLTAAGLMKKSRRGVLGLIRFRTIMRLAFWCAVAAGGLELTKKSTKLSFKAEVIAKHINSFVERRVVKPLTNILNDVVLNKRVSITDQAALKDAKRSLSVMLYDFMLQHCKSISEGERKRIANTMDMRPISEEYENELRRPMQSIVSGKIARLVLIQLQFVKKELLVAMQAIDDLFNANQVNLQLLAITPAVLSLVSLNIISKTLLGAFRATSRGRKVESSTAIQKELREGIRAIEMVLLLSSTFRAGRSHTEDTPRHHINGASGGASDIGSAGAQASTTDTGDVLESWETGKVLSHLHRLQSILVGNSNFFDNCVLKQLQEDLRDLVRPELSTAQRLAIIERVYRAFPVLQPSRKMWGSALIQ